MSYRYVYPNATPAVNAAPVTGYSVDPAVMTAGYPNTGATNMYDDRYRRRSYSPGSFSSDSASDDYEYRGRVITRETRCPRDVVRAPTPPPIIKRVVERAPTPEAPVMERVIIRPQAQEIVERVIEQPRTPPPRIIQKEMHEEAPPPIVRTRVIKVDRPACGGYLQPGSSANLASNVTPSFSNGIVGGPNPYRAQSVAGSVGRPVAYNVLDNNPSFSSASSFEYIPPAPVQAPAAAAATAAPVIQPPTQMMMMPVTQQVQSGNVLQQQMQPLGVMQQPVQSVNVMSQPVQQQMMYPHFQMTPSVPQYSNNYIPQTYMYQNQPGMTFGYRPMMQQPQQQLQQLQQQLQQQQQQARMIPAGMPMMAPGNTLAQPTSLFPGQQPPMLNPFAQQLVY